MANKKLDYTVVEVLYLGGYNMTKIADMLGSVNGHISKVLRKEGVPTRKRGEVVEPKPLKELYATVNERGYIIELLLENGYSQYAVADEFGMAQSSISKTLKAYRASKEVVKEKELETVQ